MKREDSCLVFGKEIIVIGMEREMTVGWSRMLQRECHREDFFDLSFLNTF